MKHKTLNINAKINNGQRVVTRFAPSPTGFLHVGGIRTALFNYLFSRQNSGLFILRIEDTDKTRSKKEYDTAITKSLSWTGLSYDQVYRQSKRGEIYRKYLKKLVDGGYGYISEEKDVKEGERAEVIRFKNPNVKIRFNDLIRGKVEFDTTDLGDFVIAKDMDEPLYHLAVVVDDYEMGITHVIRAEEHISNTPRQILIQQALAFPEPIYAHIPLILASDRSKLSKRHGAVSALEYKELGYLPEALINYLALLGWNPGTDEEIFTLEELVNKFDITKIQKGGAVFDIQKLNWVNRQHIMRLPDDKFIEILSEWLKPEYTDISTIKKIASQIRSRLEKFSDILVMKQNGEFEYYFKEPQYKKEKLCWKMSADFKKTAGHLSYVLKTLESMEESKFEISFIKEALWPYADKNGRGEVLWPLRYALSGKDASPDPFTLAAILGKSVTLARIKYALEKLS